MNFEFAPEHKEFQSQVARVARTYTPISAARSALESKGQFDRKAWDALAGVGIFGTTIPEAFGGNGAGHLALCVAAEELGAVLTPLPLASTMYLCAEALLVAGSDTQKSAWLSRIATGNLIGAGSLFGRELVLEGTKLSGIAQPVADGLIADVAVMLAREGGEYSLCLVDLRSDRLQRVALPCIDPARPQAQLLLDGVEAERLGPLGQGLALAEKILERAAVLTAFEQLGGAERALTMARDYALERQAFGRPIGSFQAIKHKLADVFVAVQLARSHAYYGAWAMANGAPELPIAAAGARVAASAAFTLAAEACVQTFGGIGFTWQSDCQLFYRRARYLASCLDTPIAWKERLADHVEVGRATLI